MGATDAQHGVAVRIAGQAEREAVGRLWVMFGHDMSEFTGELPGADGAFRGERLAAAFSADGWVPYLFTCAGRPAGFAFVRGVGGAARVVSSCFVVRGARRGGIGLRAVRQVVGRHPGPWEIPFQDANAGACAFWRRVAEDLAPGAWREERRAVPGRPDVPPDVWISFDTSV
ncbi:GNAT family N-acetyltransferase [Streptomyces sp. NPDC020983]|uniref:GNAT family N-acetyltransferase n=1 Tax=Streptomyces sp. NPDC020983 TaxID=3365106 RepID=UPI0037A2235B